MTTEQGGRRGPRRAVRAPGPVGYENRALLSRLPALPREQTPPTVPTPSGTATGPGPTGDAQAASEPLVAFRSKDDSDVGWGRESDSNDDRLHRDKPPHW